MSEEQIVHKHIILRIEANKPPTESELKSWIVELVEKIGMKILAGPISADIDYMVGPNGDGTLDGVELQTNSGTFSQNPWFAAYNFINDSEKERLIGSANIRWDLTDFLYVRGQV